MTQCAHCHHTFSKKEAIRQSFTLKPTVTCPVCHKENGISKKTRRRNVRISLGIPFLLLVNLLLQPNPLWLALAAVAILSYAFFILPQKYELTKEEDPLF
ncbi:hypothetical protein IRY55_04575 [Savagea sp. SN6]|uniref:Cxxc_20_cxxc protein n=1 Tax=Savagea serpentis TaxID=2785297 RepID=A0A8J7KBP4_9BACL|nr:TIGR04104 family putative zinc finger protein [Savagea serpentis]MBF4500632.1 hypothetical protein [Savagea serpentis]